MAAPPIITLTTDFGGRDPFVGILKGVMLGICRHALLVDVTHEVAPHDVLEAAIALQSSWPFFPPGAIHLAVVDPGVGGARRALALSAGGHYFVGPDNGLFSFALEAGPWRAVSLEAPAYRLATVSSTFHGRDIFAPAAAHLASGVPLDCLGPRVSDPVRLALPGTRIEDDELIGEVIGSDRFGNLLTSVTADGMRDLASAGPVTVTLGGRDLGSLATCYEEAAPAVARAILGSSGRLEIFVRRGSARDLLGAGRGTPVRVRPA
jgi:S-adenosyl-L-methionine hydrolase (adenosine-forming)